MRTGPIALTPHPAWMEELLKELTPAFQRACWPPLFAMTRDGQKPPLAHWRKGLAYFFPIVEAFPKYMGLSLSKTTYGRTRGDEAARAWLLANLSLEARHLDWYIDWMAGAGLAPADVFKRAPAPGIAALHQHLWEVCQRGTLAEGIMASNWAVEGITGVWTAAVADRFAAYAADGARIDAKSMMWLRAHARYDDAHPLEALELVKLTIGDAAAQREGVARAARKTLELYYDAMRRAHQDVGEPQYAMQSSVL